MIKEDLLQYIWQFQQFSKRKIMTTQGHELKVIKPGQPNKNSGPDFSDAHILINGKSFYGQIEVHVDSSSWYTHHHHQNKAYDHVVLHVVWNDDKPVIHTDGTTLPTLLIKNYINLKLLARYTLLSQSSSPIPCANHLQKTTKKTWRTMLEKALLQRLSDKCRLVHQLWEANKNDAEATAYQLLANNFGFKINSQVFLHLSKCIPLKLVQKNAKSLLHLEALFLGQAGLLPTNSMTAKINQSTNPYLHTLIQTHHYLTHKYKLATSIDKSQWKFSRLRLANSPFIRITQFASLLHQHHSLFYLLINTPTQQLHQALAIKQSHYWQTHYQLDKKSKKPISRLGQRSIDNIIINTVVPILATYGKLHHNEYYINRALDILVALPAEQNSITKKWQKLNIPIPNALASQGSLELFNHFCSLRKCLSCDIGKLIMRKNNTD
ncbi:MAG: DUF2851 family protein [Bacteroidota bacterium]